MPSEVNPDTGLPLTLHTGGRYYTEAELASAAAHTLESRKLTGKEAAEALGIKPSAVSMALSLVERPAGGKPHVLKYPTRGHKTRREILRRWAHLTFSGDGDGWSEVRPNGEPVYDGSDLDAPTYTQVWSRKK